MAELSISNRKKLVPKVDLTAMVDLAFLLITFFMLSTSLAKPVAMDVVKPDQLISGVRISLPASRTLTILLGKNDQAAWYMGEADKTPPHIVALNQIRKVLLINKDAVAKANKNDPSKTLIVVIKPTRGASYKNFVDVMDELNVVNLVNAPAIDDEHITAAEELFMKRL